MLLWISKIGRFLLDADSEMVAFMHLVAFTETCMFHTNFSRQTESCDAKCGLLSLSLALELSVHCGIGLTWRVQAKRESASPNFSGSNDLKQPFPPAFAAQLSSRAQPG
ncbi:MYB family transcription factor [Musa troglodytarum]|uniref:MYB family transcription factor n=1 Tax=Musa troglodytarum TaxID=320322 RepID=A0A9E7EKV1_9LILI|nr:MYB family transcription factor [Musa troglodytarum]